MQCMACLSQMAEKTLCKQNNIKIRIYKRFLKAFPKLRGLSPGIHGKVTVALRVSSSCWFTLFGLPWIPGLSPKLSKSRL